MFGNYMVDFNDYFRYDERSTSLLINTCDRGRRIISGEPVNLRADKDGYLMLTLNGKAYYAHRVIWAMHYGNIPQGMEIDHINKNVSDNLIENLRLATRAQNCWNQRKRGNSNLLLPKGITEKRPGYYRASVMASGIRVRKNSSSIEYLTSWLDTQRSIMHKEYKSHQ